MSLNQQHGRKLALTIDNLSTNNNNIKSLEKNMTLNETIETKEETPNELLSKILDTINSNSLNIFYHDSNSDFKKKIDSLNLKFYLETEKYLSNKNCSENCQTSLFIILFKQINIYIEEIERLNLIIIKRKYDPKKIMERTDELIKKQNEFLTKEKLIKTLKESKSNMETKLLESIINEDKLKKEIQNLKKENEIFKKQLSKKMDKNNIYCNTHKKKSTHLLNELTYYIQGCENGGNSRKRNNSDISKTLLNSTFKKLIKNDCTRANKGGKVKLNNFHKKNDINNNNTTITTINNSTISTINHTTQSGQISISSYLNKKPTIHIKLNNRLNRNELPNNLVNNSQSINKSTNIDMDIIKPIKTEYIINNIYGYNKGTICEYNSSIVSTDNKKNKENNNKENIKDKYLEKKFCSKSKEIKDKNILDNKDIIKKRNSGFSSNLINCIIGKNPNERKKKYKINI